MKSIKSVLLLLLFFLVQGAEAAVGISGESGFYLLRSLKKYERQEGYGLWKGRKSGFYYDLEISLKQKVTGSTDFNLSVITGNPKISLLSLFTSPEDRISPYSSKSFNVKELFLRKRHFIFEDLELKVGKQKVDVSPLFSDYLWGGSFSYFFSSELSLTWRQLAGYEGKYLLGRGEDEDDIDIFNLELGWRSIKLGFFRISDARGNQSGVEKNALYANLSWNFYGADVGLSAAVQSGKNAEVVSLSLGEFSLDWGHSERGFTSYGFGEGERDLGLLAKPKFSGVSFLRLSYSFAASPFKVKTYLLELNSPEGTEVGGEVSYPFLYGDLFLRGAKSGKDYLIMAGYRWGLKNRLSCGSWKVENFFSLSGEYTDMPVREYVPQAGYEGWEKARHAGFWHTTYRISLQREGINIKVATGPSSKRDYIVWGNTAEEFKYQRKHGKLWHLEELYYSRSSWQLGIKTYSFPGYFEDEMAGLFVQSKGVSAALATDDDDPDERALYALLGFSRKPFSVNYVARSKNGSRVSTLSVSVFTGYFGLNLLKQSGSGWGARIDLSKRVCGGKLNLAYALYSNSFKTFNLKEYYRNTGLTVRPSERDIRIKELSYDRDLRLGWKKLKKLSPSVRIFYRNFRRYSGSYITDEGGVTFSIKPGKCCSLSVTGALGAGDTFYEGLTFSVVW